MSNNAQHQQFDHSQTGAIIDRRRLSITPIPNSYIDAALGGKLSEAQFKVYLCLLFQAFGHPQPAYDHRAIAAKTGLTPTVVTRALGDLDRKGYIRKRIDGIDLPDPPTDREEDP
jgi:DNA-binding MarR family transcriptional regulator